MNLQAKLTLGYVLLAVVIVSVISTIDLATSLQQQFETTLERADFVNPLASKAVAETLNSDREAPLRQALRSPALATELLDLLTNARPILEIAAVDPKTNEVFASSDPSRVGPPEGPYPDFRELVNNAGLIAKAKLMMAPSAAQYYQLQRALATQAGDTLLLVRVVIAPALIRDELKRPLQRNAILALFCVAGAVAV